MFASNGITPTGFNSIEALRDTNPEMAGAVDVVYRRMAITDKAIENTRRALGIVPASREVQTFADRQEYPGQTFPSNPTSTVETEAVMRRTEAEYQRQVAMGVGARERLQAIPDNNPVLYTAAENYPLQKQSEVASQVAYISQIADSRYNNFQGMN